MTKEGLETPFDVPAAGTGTGQGTFSSFINQTGTIVGTYVDPSSLNHGFRRTANGTMASFDCPYGNGTWAFSTNATGMITGFCYDTNGVLHGYLVTP
jgi:hypothetical protein